MLQTLSDSRERAQHELGLQIALGSALMVTKGYAVPEVEQAYARARELCKQVGETPDLLPVLWGLSSFYGMRGEPGAAQAIREQVLRLAQRTQDPTMLLIAHRLQGVFSYGQGELATARSHLEQELALYDRHQHPALAFHYGGYDPGVHCLGYLAATLWQLGYPDQALQRIQEAITLAQDLAHSPSLAYALMWAAGIHNLRREAPAAQAQAAAAIALATAQGWPHFEGESRVIYGGALVAQGQVEEGMAQIQQGRAIYQATGAAPSQLGHLITLASAYGQAGQAQEGLRVVAEALVMVPSTGQPLAEAGLYLLRGSLLLKLRRQQPEEVSAQGLESEVEACFLKAMEIARGQSAKSLELRAVMSLSRLWQHQGKKAEAHQMLVELYTWFTEGFATKDLQEAKALLEELC